MGEELKIIYRILKSLRASMDAEEFDVRLISNETLGISKPKWSRLIAMLVSDGYIDGVSVTAIDNMPLPLVELGIWRGNPRPFNDRDESAACFHCTINLLKA